MEKANAQEPDKPRKLRLLCSACKHWIEVGDNAPMHVFTHSSGLLKPKDEAEEKDMNKSSGFMYRHMTRCKRYIAAIHEDDPRWGTLDEANREYDTPAA
jgi:hypothetical protein